MYNFQKLQEWRRKLFEIEARKEIIGLDLAFQIPGSVRLFERVVDIDFVNRYIECYLGCSALYRFVFLGTHNVGNLRKADEEIYYICGYCGYAFPLSHSSPTFGDTPCNRKEVNYACRTDFIQQYESASASLKHVKFVGIFNLDREKAKKLYLIRRALFFPYCVLRYEFDIPIGNFLHESPSFCGLPVKWIGLDEIMDYKLNTLECLIRFKKFQNETYWGGDAENIDSRGMIETLEKSEAPRIVSQQDWIEYQRQHKRERDEETDQKNVKLTKIQEEDGDI